MSSSAFATDLDEELATVASERVHALESVVCERYAALRYSLDRCNRNACDGYATDETPGLDAEVPVETKGVRLRHHDGEGRLNVHLDSHETLVEEGGYYAVVLYTTVEHGGDERVIVLESAIVTPEEIGRWTDGSGSPYQKVRWSQVLPDRGVDRARWSQ
ncbi:hypothetical protein [Salinarchaeum laminariae]|uniref:hypothetical protein n=1 Tax=Salinarchaeum laminariae TaxID=869888 RepID=UPI0020BEF9E7|nr:hypothetical protein [Salinarchaeum laminariae]